MTDNDETRVRFGELPGVVATAENVGIDVSSPEPLNVHLDDVDDSTYATDAYPVRVYIYGDEDDRAEELREVCDDLRNEFVFAHGVVLPADLREDGPPSSEEITALIHEHFYGNTTDPSGS